MESLNPVNWGRYQPFFFHIMPVQKQCLCKSKHFGPSVKSRKPARRLIFDHEPNLRFFSLSYSWCWFTVPIDRRTIDYFDLLVKKIVQASSSIKFGDFVIEASGDITITLNLPINNLFIQKTWQIRKRFFLEHRASTKANILASSIELLSTIIDCWAQ